MELADLNPDSPVRPVDWRWRRAEALNRLGSRAAHLGDLDRFVSVARAFLRDHAACHDEVDRAELRGEYPDFFDARALWLAEDVDPGLRYEVAARLLAGDTDEHIALRVGTRVEVIRWFEALYYHISDKRDNEGYLLHFGIGSAVHAGVAPHEYDRYWKLVGLAMGPVVLDAVIGNYRKMRITDPAQVEAALSDQQRGLLRRQALKAAGGVRLRDPSAALTALELELRCQEAERQAGTGESNDLVLKALQSVFTALRWTPPGQPPPLPELAKFRGLAAVPRAHELQAAIINGTTDQLYEKLKDKKFPPPPRKEGGP